MNQDSNGFIKTTGNDRKVKFEMITLCVVVVFFIYLLIDKDDYSRIFFTLLSTFAGIIYLAGGYIIVAIDKKSKTQLVTAILSGIIIALTTYVVNQRLWGPLYEGPDLYIIPISIIAMIIVSWIGYNKSELVSVRMFFRRNVYRFLILSLVSFPIIFSPNKLLIKFTWAKDSIAYRQLNGKE